MSWKSDVTILASEIRCAAAEIWSRDNAGTSVALTFGRGTNYQKINRTSWLASLMVRNVTTQTALQMFSIARYAINMSLFAGMLITRSVCHSNAVCVAGCSLYGAA